LKAAAEKLVSRAIMEITTRSSIRVNEDRAIIGRFALAKLVITALGVANTVIIAAALERSGASALDRGNRLQLGLKTIILGAATIKIR